MVDDLGSRSASVLIALERRFVRHSLVEFLKNNSFRIVCELESPRQLREIKITDDPDLCIIGTSHLVDSDQLKSDCTIVRQRFPDSRIVLVDLELSKERTLVMREQGFDAFLSLSLTPELILDGLRLVLAGHECFPSHTVSGEKCATPGAVDFTPREQDILRLVTHGLANKEIARDLCISESTVKVHMHSVLQKIGATNRTQVACWAVEHGYSGIRLNADPAPP
jgi:two-component system nitrate/nitrite response regulator NarL